MPINNNRVNTIAAVTGLGVAPVIMTEKQQALADKGGVPNVHAGSNGKGDGHI